MRDCFGFYTVDQNGAITHSPELVAGAYKITLRRGLFGLSGLVHLSKIDVITKEMTITETVWFRGRKAESMGTKSTATYSEGGEFFRHLMFWLRYAGIECISGWSPRKVANYLCRRFENCTEIASRYEPRLGVELVQVRYKTGVKMKEKIGYLVFGWVAGAAAVSVFILGANATSVYVTSAICMVAYGIAHSILHNRSDVASMVAGLQKSK